jgi:hypothetical protein
MLYLVVGLVLIQSLLWGFLLFFSLKRLVDLQLSVVERTAEAIAYPGSYKQSNPEETPSTEALSDDLTAEPELPNWLDEDPFDTTVQGLRPHEIPR